MNITSRQLKAFLLTARHQSFSRAAEQLYITQSGMSVLIRELEEQLGFRLFDRTTRRVTLTEFGNKFLPIADRSLLELESAAANIGRSASVARRQFTIGAMPFIANKLLPTAIQEYARHDAQLQVVLRDVDRNKLLAMVGTGEIDGALGCFIEQLPDMRRVLLHRFSFMAVQAQANKDRGMAAPLRWKDLAEARLLGAPVDNPVQQLIERTLQRAGRREPTDLIFNYLDTMIAMAETGAGIAVVPSFAVRACAEHNVSMHPLVEPALSIDFVQIMDRGRKLPPGADEFNDFLKRYIAQWADVGAPALVRAA
jgi:DNA-binding transcriptional LysR family regulator